MNMGPPSGDAFDKSSTSCTNLQNSDAELGIALLLAHPVNCRWGIVRAGTLWNKRFIWNKYLFWKRNVYFCVCLTQLNDFEHLVFAMYTKFNKNNNYKYRCSSCLSNHQRTFRVVCLGIDVFCTSDGCHACPQYLVVSREIFTDILSK